MFGRRLAGHPDHRLSDNTKQTLGGIVVVAVMIAAIVISILLSPTIPLGH
ncbi:MULTISPECIES: hypothetical protein [Nguyenibacter]|uniref:Uncharacterized protein n=1 Tax=Nguyenibacter vanlangensis TaxID=1216886 RepID=A0A7Y7IXH8_9PROT|nr:MULTISPECIES: hypothetical protein [Nguyenibacter]NVN12185.1 hypothetical protein [Nguyenibacter vanlangensis]WRH87426.1 hypothetical protein QN315_15850 [Nguyenibacter sp. L1]